MMGALSDDDEEYRFFDAQEDVATEPTCAESSGSCCEVDDWVSSGFGYDMWIRSPRSVEERRTKFLSWMELNLNQIVRENSIEACNESGSGLKGEADNIAEENLLRARGFKGELSLSRYSMSSWSKVATSFSEESGSSMCRIRNLDGVAECNVRRLEQDGRQAMVQIVSSERLRAAEEFDSTSESSSSAQQHSQRGIEVARNSTGMINRAKNRWLSRLRSMTCMMDGQGKANNSRPICSDPVRGSRIQRVKVHHRRKQSKELSALYVGQDIQAHEGSILTMKFSLDGQYLASAGEDGIVRVWQVVEDDRSNEVDIPDIDASCIYFTVNHLSELTPVTADKEKMGVLKSLQKKIDSACVIFPPKVFRILEKPLHEFCGHNGEILDLSWSRNNYLLSSSIDKTVRLWCLGSHNCLKVFSHSNYVTCVQFNPVDDDHFISGSIDGKVRIWAITGCQVVNWTDIRDMVTAVCYRPDGKGGVVGCINGNCRFYTTSDNQFQLEYEICLHSKKKSSCKRITGFQFYPQDSSKLMITCADSQIRILHGTNLIGKYKGFRNAGNQILASFTSDGKHIVSACEDSNIYVWNCIGQEESSISRPKNFRSCEYFSNSASVAIPWPGLRSENLENGGKVRILDDSLPNVMPFSSPICFSLGQQFILESFPKGSATWPEEKLPSSSPLVAPSAMGKSQYKFFKASCQSTSSSHSWGMVIVSGGWDGRIKSFHNYGLPVPL